MALWGGKDQANNSPIFGPALVNKTPNETNRDALFENATLDAYIVGETVGVYGNQVTETGPSGWVLKRIGSGGRAGRTFSEVLVAMGSIGPGDVTPPVGDSYWIATLAGVDGEWGTRVTTDSQNNIYIAGITTSDSSGWRDLLIAKYNSSGLIQWQRLLGATGADTGYGITTDSQNNVYVVGYTDSQGEGSTDLLIAKYNSSGDIQWQKLLGGVGSEYVNVIKFDSQDNVYVVGYTASQGAGNNDLLIVKYNSSGNIQWQKLLGGVNTEYGLGMTIDSQDNVYVIGYTDSQGAGASDLLIVKYNSSGDIQWQKLLGGVDSEMGYGITTDSQNNVYIAGVTTSQGEGSNDLLIAKYNSSGDIQWQKLLGGVSSDYVYEMTIDSQDNVYIAGESTTINPNYNCLIAKYNSDGVLQFVRGFGRTSTVYNSSYSIALDSNDNIVITGENDTENDYMVLTVKLPNDGSLTGTYGDFTYYEVTDFVSNTATLTSNTATLTSNTATLTSNTATLTDKAGNLVSTLITIS